MAFAVTVTSGPTSNGPKQIVQRTSVGGGATGVALSGSYTGATVGMDFKIECRIVLHGTSTEVLSWTPAPIERNTLGVGTFNVAFPEIDLGGWYNFQFRASTRDGTAQTDNKTVKWGVGLLFMLMGQSNSVQIYTEESTPDVADDKIGAWLNLTPASYSGTKQAEWLDLGTDTMGDGLHKLLNRIQAGVTEDTGALGDIPVGVIAFGVGSSAVTELGNWLDAGLWRKGQTLYTAAMGLLHGALGNTKVEGVLWQQGENEAVVYADPTTPGRWPGPGYYYNGIKGLYEDLEKDLDTPHDRLKMVFNGPCRNYQLWSQVASVAAFVLANARVNADLLKFVNEDPDNRGFSQAHRGALGADAVHMTAAGAETVGQDMADAMLAIIGASTTNARSKVGPRITAAYMGTETAPTDRTKITLYVEHEKGTSLVLGQDSSIQAFEVYDAAGPLCVNAAALHADGDKIELTLESVTTQTAGRAVAPYSRPNKLVGNWAAVRYATWPALNPVFFIKDNATVPAYLQPTWKDESTGHVPGMVIDKYPDLSDAFIKSPVKAVTGTTVKTFTIDGFTDWAKSAGTARYVSGLAPLTIKPGDRCTLHNLIGAWKGDSIVQQVTSAADDDTDWLVKIVDDFDGATVEVTGGIEDRILFNPEPEAAGAILVKSRIATYLGYGGPDR
jgi:hypothetical protein